MNASVLPGSDLDLRSTHARLEQLERSEWFRWAGALVVTLALTVGLVLLSLPAGSRGSDRSELDVALRGLLALVLLFDSFVIYQQVLITRLRRQLTSQLGLIAALDLVKYPEPKEQDMLAVAPTDRRRWVRFNADQQLRIKTVGHAGKEVSIQGRLRNMSEHGLGAVIPASLEPGDVLTVEFTADGCELALRAVVRYRRGFQYGMEFVSLSERDIEALQKLRGGGQRG